MASCKMKCIECQEEINIDEYGDPIFHYFTKEDSDPICYDCSIKKLNTKNEKLRKALIDIRFCMTLGAAYLLAQKTLEE